MLAILGILVEYGFVGDAADDDAVRWIGGWGEGRGAVGFLGSSDVRCASSRTSAEAAG